MTTEKLARRDGLLRTGVVWIGMFGLCMALMGLTCPGADQCPDDPDKTEPGICGCGVPDDDTDGDGTPDCIDECPNDPDKIEEGVCGCGVPDDDTDGDGVEDCIDNCPDVANPGQEDTSGNGVGDACDIQVTITGPTTATGGDTITQTATIPDWAGVGAKSAQWLITAPLTAGSAAILPADGRSQVLTVVLSIDAEGVLGLRVTVTDANGTTGVAETDITVGAGSPELVFTLGTDDLVGTAGDDLFRAPLEFSGGVQVMTLQPGDVADGGAGTDTLNMFVNAAITPTNLENIEIFNVTQVGAGTITASNVTGLTTLNVGNPTAAVDVADLQDIVDLNVSESAQNVTLAFDAAAVAEADDAINLAASEISAGTWTIADIENATLDSTGSDPNVIDALAMAALEALTVTGDQDVEITAALGATVESLDASAATGGVTAQLTGAGDVSITGGAGDDDIAELSNGGDITVALGAGDDRISLAGLEDTGDSVDGGDGDDTLAVPSAVATAWAEERANVTSVEALGINDALAGDLDLPTVFPAGIDLVLEAGIDSAAARTITALNGIAITIEADTADGVAASHVVTIAGTAIADTIDLTMDDADFLEALDLNGVEICNLMAETDASVIADLEMIPSDPPGPSIGTTTVNVSGEEDVELTSVTVQTVDGSAMTGDLTVGGATAEVAITGGAGDDDLTGSAAGDVVAGGDGDDTLDGAAGDDDVSGGAGADTITGGDGSDLINAGDGDDDVTGGAGADDITAGAGADSIDYNTATDSLNTALDELQDFTSGTDVLDVAVPPTTSGSGTVGPDLNTGTTASTGTTAGTLATDIATVVAAAAANAFDQAGDTLVITITGASIGGTGAVYVVIEDGTTLTTYNPAEDTVILLGGTSSTTLTLEDFE